MIDVTTTIQEYVDFLKTRKSCEPAIPWFEGMIKAGLIYIKDITKAINEGKTSYDPNWAQWSLRDHGDQMTPAFQKTLIGRIKEPMFAFQLYRDLEWLPDDSKIILKKLFEGKLPEAEKQL